MMSYHMNTAIVDTLGRIIKITSRATSICVTSTPTCGLVDVFVQLKVPPASLGASAPTNLEAVQKIAAVSYLSEMNKVNEIRSKIPPDQIYVRSQYRSFWLSHISLICAYSHKKNENTFKSSCNIEVNTNTTHLHRVIHLFLIQFVDKW